MRFLKGIATTGSKPSSHHHGGEPQKQQKDTNFNTNIFNNYYLDNGAKLAFRNLLNEHLDLFHMIVISGFLRFDEICQCERVCRNWQFNIAEGGGWNMFFNSLPLTYKKSRSLRKSSSRIEAYENECHKPHTLTKMDMKKFFLMI